MSHKQSEARTPLWVRVAIPILGTVSLGIVNTLCDWFILPTVTFGGNKIFGAVEGGGVSIFLLTTFFFIINFVCIRVYDYAKLDLFGIEALKAIVLRDQIARTRKHRIAHMWANIGVFLIWSIYDPIYATLYLRQGTGQYNGFNRGDWLILWCSTTYAVAVGVFLWSIGIEVVEYFRIIPFILNRWFG